MRPPLLTLALGGYQQFTETGDNYIYFDNAQTNYLKWNDTGDQFEFANGLIFTNATATDSFYASNIFITNGGNFNAVTTTDTAYIGGQLQVAGAPTSTIASSLAIDTNTLVVNANEARVGIVTLHPQQALDVTGNAQVSGRLAVGTTDNSLYTLNVLGNSYLSGSATTTGSFYIAGSASTTQLFVQGTGHIGGNTTLDGTLTLLGAADLNSTLTVVSTSDFQGNVADSLGDFTIADNLIVSGNATTTGYLVIGTTQPTMNMAAGDLLIGRNATTTGSHYIGGDLSVAGNYLLTGGMNMNSATVTDTLAIGGYQQFTETADNYIYFDNAITNYLKWNDASDQFEFANGLNFTNATATDSFYASNIFITNGGNFNAVTTTDTAYIGGKLQVAGAPTSTIASSLAIDTNTLVVNANEARVGIVTLHPQQALDVTGNAQVSGRLAVFTLRALLLPLNYLSKALAILAAIPLWTEH